MFWSKLKIVVCSDEALRQSMKVKDNKLDIHAWTLVAILKPETTLFFVTG